MKPSILLLTAACLAGLATPALAQTYEVNQEGLTLRSGPSTGSTPLGTLKRGDRISAGHDRWMRVAVESGSLKGKVGYVARRGVEESAWTEEKAYVKRVTSGTSYVITGVSQSATLRNAMSSSAAGIQQIPRGDFVVSLSAPTGSGWHYVQVVETGKKGWIPARYLAKN